MLYGRRHTHRRNYTRVFTNQHVTLMSATRRIDPTAPPYVLYRNCTGPATIHTPILTDSVSHHNRRNRGEQGEEGKRNEEPGVRPPRRSIAHDACPCDPRRDRCNPHPQGSHAFPFCSGRDDDVMKVPRGDFQITIGSSRGQGESSRMRICGGPSRGYYTTGAIVI